MFTFGRKPLLDACLLAAKSVKAGNTTMPVMKCLHLQSKTDGSGTLMITGTDTETTTSVCVSKSIIVSQSAETCVDAAQLIQILREGVEEEVEATLTDKSFKITCGSFKPVVGIADPKTMPQMPAFETSASGWSFDRVQLAEALDRTWVSSSENEEKYAYHTIVFNGAHFASTDGKRISVQNITPIMEGNGPKVLVRHGEVRKMIQILRASSDERASIITSDNQVMLVTDGVVFRCRTCAGHLPEYQKWCTDKFQWETSFKTGELLKCVTQGALMTDKETCRVSLHYKGDGVTVRALCATKGKVESSIKGNVPIGMDVLIHFDPSYLTDMLRTLPSEDQVVIRFNGPENKVLMEVPNGRYYVVPLVEGKS